MQHTFYWKKTDYKKVRKYVFKIMVICAIRKPSKVRNSRQMVVLFEVERWKKASLMR